MKKRRRRVIKLTRADGTTWGGFRYKVGKPVTAPGGGDLCTSAYLHAYRTAREAAFFRPLHGVERHDAAWLADAVVERGDDPSKLGCTRITLKRHVTLPAIDTETRVTAAILRVLDGYDPVSDNGAWDGWAEAWLSGEDRSAYAAADAAAYAVASAAADAGYAAAGAAASAGYAAVGAAGSMNALLAALGVPSYGRQS